jgi:hypothetical protein
MKRCAFIFLAVTLLCLHGAGQKASQPSGSKDDHDCFPNNEFIAKGGIGIINTSLYIDLKSARNELRLSGNKRWTGKDAQTPEVAILFADKVWSPQAVPAEFDLSKATVVSFERSKVRFFDFTSMSGGYYKRPGQQ